MPTPFEKSEQLASEVDALVAAAAHEILSDPINSERIHESINLLGKTWKEMRPALLKFYNTFTSTVDELANEQTTPRRAEGAILHACAALKEFANNLELHNRLPEDEAERREFLEQNQDDAASQILRKNAAIANKLRLDILPRGFTVSLAPILPLCSFNREKLARANVPFDNLNGYTVLNKQRTLGISFRFIKQQLESSISEETDPLLTKKVIKFLKSPTMDDKTFHTLDEVSKKVIDRYFQEAVDVFLSRNSSLEVVGVPHAWQGARWYWLVPKNELRVLRSCVFSNASKFDKWGFAFSRRDLTGSNAPKAPSMQEKLDRPVMN